jgi:hypothetical protein
VLVVFIEDIHLTARVVEAQRLSIGRAGHKPYCIVKVEELDLIHFFLVMLLRIQHLLIIIAGIDKPFAD